MKSDALLAFILFAFIAINMVTYFLFARSHKMVVFRQPALPSQLLSGLAICGGAVAAYFAIGKFRTVSSRVISRQIVSVLALVQVGILGLLLVQSLTD